MNYIDLGLPSGTRWADQDLPEFCPCKDCFQLDTVARKGYQIPTLEQFQELVNCCEKEFNQATNAWCFKGPNGNVIIFEMKGFCEYNIVTDTTESRPHYTGVTGFLSSTLSDMPEVIRSFFILELGSSLLKIRRGFKDDAYLIRPVK